MRQPNRPNLDDECFCFHPFSLHMSHSCHEPAAAISKEHHIDMHNSRRTLCDRRDLISLRVTLSSSFRKARALPTTSTCTTHAVHSVIGVTSYRCASLLSSSFHKARALFSMQSHACWNALPESAPPLTSKRRTLRPLFVRWRCPVSSVYNTW